MSEVTVGDERISEKWYLEHFDHFEPELSREFNETLDSMRRECPVAHSDRHGGFWVATRYDDVLAVLQDWRTFSSAEGVAVPVNDSFPPFPLVEMDPPIHRIFRRLVNEYLTPAKVAPYEEPTRQMVTELIDEFIETGHCEFMTAFAEQIPRRSFFELVLHAQADDIAHLNELIRIVTGPSSDPGVPEAYTGLVSWITGFVERRRAEAPRGDIVDAILSAEVDGRPMTLEEIIGLTELLMFGGFETTASALGNIMIRFAHDPGIPDQLKARPELIPVAVEEFLRLDAPVVNMGRTATRDTDLGGHPIHKGDKILFHLGSANRDEEQFACPVEFDLGRPSNRHLAFGAGPHRCAGSNLARQNLRIALEELTARLDGIRLQHGAGPIEYRTAFNRSPAAVPIEFTPGPRVRN